MERSPNGRLHYHLLVDCSLDIHGGLDFEAVKRQDYRSANSALRGLWSLLRREAPKYGFGRTELLPLRLGADAVGHYIFKDIS